MDQQTDLLNYNCLKPTYGYLCFDTILDEPFFMVSKQLKQIC